MVKGTDCSSLCNLTLGAGTRDLITHRRPVGLGNCKRRWTDSFISGLSSWNFAVALKLLQASVETNLPKESQNHDPLLHAVRTWDRFEEDDYIERLGPIYTREKEQVAFIETLLMKGIDVDELVLRDHDGRRREYTPPYTAIGRED